MAASRFAVVPLAVAGDQDLKEGDLRVLMVLIAHADKEGLCWPSREVISHLTGLRENKVSSATGNLVRLGWISKSGSGGRGKPPTYRVNKSRNKDVNPPQIGTLSAPETLPKSGPFKPETLPKSGPFKRLNPPQIGTLSESYPQALLSLRDKENTEEEEEEEKKCCVKKNQAHQKPTAKGLPHADLFDQAWELAREVNRATAGRCCRKTSLARWSAKCKDLDAATRCLECWRLEVDSRRADSGLGFQRGFQVYLNAEPWTDPHAIEDLRAAKHNAENGNEHTNGNGNGTRRKTEAERYHENMAEARRRRGDPDPDSYRIEGLDDDYEEFYRRQEFKGRTFDA